MYSPTIKPPSGRFEGILSQNIDFQAWDKCLSPVPEIEFLAQYEGQVFPCEVKAEQNVKAKSLRTFITNGFPELSLHGLRFSMLPYVNQEWMENYPLSGVEGRFYPQDDE